MFSLYVHMFLRQLYLVARRDHRIKKGREF